MDSLYENLSDVLKEEEVTRTLPDYIDGENKEFELYWDDNTVVNTEKDENLFLTINAVLQRPKFTEVFPLGDSYVIDKTVIPNKIKFDVAPIWDQDLGAKTIGEPTAVEKVAGIGVGNYKRLTIDYNLVDGVRNGPFLILDVEDNTVQNIESEDSLYVFLDGVLQVKGKAYTVSGPNITFHSPIQSEMIIDIRYLYGRDVGQVLNIYDYAPDTYFAQGTFSFDSTVLSALLKYDWMGDAVGSSIQVWQQRANGTYNVIGEIRNPVSNGNNVVFDIKGQNGSPESGLDYTFVPKGYYERTFVIADADISNVTVSYVQDDSGRKILKDDNGIWSGSNYGITYKKPFVSLSNGDRIRVDGEEGFRNIKRLPSEATSKDGRDGEQLTDDIFSSVSVESYTGTTRGEGLSVVATIQNGSVVKLTWNQRSYDPITQPTAYQYFTPPVLKFIPENGEGGGARANVLVSKGQVISVDLIDGGSGYTKAPKVITTRRFDILSDRDIGISLINVAIRPYLNVSQTGLIISTIDILGNRLVDVNSYSSVDLRSPADADRKITAEIQIDKDNIVDGESGFDMPAGIDQPGPAQIVFIEPQPVEIEGVGGVLRLQGSVSVVSAEVQDIVSLNSISTVSRAVTSNIQKIIPNDALSNINFFETAAYLDVDFNIGDSIAYIPDTTKFDLMGLLLVGDEVVYYNRKLSDRFTNILRGQKGTTEQNWTAGTFLRQIPELVSVAPVGVVQIQTESDVTMISIGFVDSGFERKVQRQVTSFDDLEITKSALEVVLTPPPGGVVDGYAEEIFLTDPIPVRSGNTTGGHDGEVDLIEINGGYHVAKRNATEVLIVNSIFGRTAEYIGQYTKTNVGHTISHFEGIFDDGAAGVSGLSLGELDLYFGSLTIRDFEERGKSSYTLAGNKFVMMPPSIQNPVTTSQSSGTIGGPIVVADTTHFPDSGYLFHNTAGVSSTQGYTWTQDTYGLSGAQNLETTANKKFGDRSVFLDETAGSVDGSKITAPIGTHLGAGDFTIDFWAKKEISSSSGDTSAGLLYYGTNLQSGASWKVSSGALDYFLPMFGFSIYVNSVWSFNLSSIIFWNGGDDSYTNCGNLSTNWTHFAITRSSGTIKVFVNGVEKASKTNTQDYTQAGAIASGNAWGTGGQALFSIGSSNYSTGLDCFNGYIDEVHISNIARYTSSFTPPTARVLPDNYTTSYDNFDTPIPSNSGVIQYTGKTATSFTGCSHYRGSTTIASGSEIIPFSPV